MHYEVLTFQLSRQRIQIIRPGQESQYPAYRRQWVLKLHMGIFSVTGNKANPDALG